MSREFGPATQNGIVVPDLDQALAYWTRSLCVGPFYRFDHAKNAYVFQRGQELPLPDLSIALGNWGDLQIELICPHGESQSTWHQYLKKTGGGLHHISAWSENYDRDVERAAQLGEIECRGQLLDGPRYCYFQCDIPGQPLLEISDLTPMSAEIYAHIRSEAKNWDGSDPVRMLG